MWKTHDRKKESYIIYLKAYLVYLASVITTCNSRQLVVKKSVVEMDKQWA